MAKDIKISEVVVVDGKPVVRGTVGETPFEAATKQWGSKMLMNVAAEGLDRGTRIAIGHAAKRAVKAAQMVLPEAVLKRPRKAKEVEASTVTVTVAPLLSDDVGPLPTLVAAEEGFFTLAGIGA